MTSSRDKSKEIVYEIYVQSFQDSNGDGIGDLRGIIERLDYLHELGVTMLWLTPIYQSPMVDNGYDISDYKKINPTYGSMADFDLLVQEAHRRGIGIMMDLVVNHTSDKHEWFIKSCQSTDNKYSDYYIWRDPVNGGVPTNLGSVFGGSAWEYVPERNQYYLHLFAKQQPDLNWQNPELRQAIYNVMNFWIKHGIDGFRMDSISLIAKPVQFKNAPLKSGMEYTPYHEGIANGTQLHEYLHEMYTEVLDGNSLLTVGETPHTSLEQARRYLDPNHPELDMIFQFEHMHCDYGEYGRYSDVVFKLSDLKRSLNRWQTGLPWNSVYLGNHDQPRIVSRFGDEKYREKSAKMLAMVVLFQRGTPFIYQGDELGMSNCNFNEISDYHDIETHNKYHELLESGVEERKAFEMIRAKSRDNGRTPMQWEDNREAGFTTQKPWIKVNSNFKTVNVQCESGDPKSILTFYRKLINLRKENEVLVDGDFTPLSVDDSAVFAFERKLKDRAVVVVCSFVAQKIRYILPSQFKGKNATKLIGNYASKNCKLKPIMYLEPYECLAFDIKAEGY